MVSRLVAYKLFLNDILFSPYHHIITTAVTFLCHHVVCASTLIIISFCFFFLIKAIMIYMYPKYKSHTFTNNIVYPLRFYHQYYFY